MSTVHIQCSNNVGSNIDNKDTHCTLLYSLQNLNMWKGNAISFKHSPKCIIAKMSYILDNLHVSYIACIR